MKHECAKAALAAALTAAFVGPLAPAVLAHGDSHAKRKAVDYSSAEEKPFGRAGNPSKVNRTVLVEMEDSMHFVTTASAQPRRRTDVGAAHGRHMMPGDIVVKRGETIRFRVRNDGRIMHEMVIGTMKELKEHAELMKKFPGMEHDEPYMAHVAPGKEGEIVWQFTRAGEFHYACLIPGHMEAGMISKITVTN